MTSYRFIDLFAGLGGFHFALSQLGMECVFASEIKEDLRKQYAINFPGTRIEGDITQIKPEDIPEHDILCAGFPCQPFSQAGKRQGFLDEKDRGTLFYYIREIIRCHRPKYILLENVQNLKGHDDGNTWKLIKKTLEVELEYDVKAEVLSPHIFGIPQHRKRFFIACIDKKRGNLDSFEFPYAPRGKFKCDITKIIDSNDCNVVKLRPETREQLAVWQEFVDELTKRGKNIPTFPIWAMEFNATYDYEHEAPAYQTLSQLQGKKGHLGHLVDGCSIEDCLMQLPVYARTNKSREFPVWKKRYIRQNRELYLDNKEWIDKWLPKIEGYENSHMKFEWNCGKATPTIYDKIIQFRASGIRVKLPTFSPALNLVGTQTPIFPWVELPKSILEDGEPAFGRYMTIKEAATIQGMKSLNFDVLTLNRTSEALGNAVNVTLVKHIAKKLLAL